MLHEERDGEPLLGKGHTIEVPGASWHGHELPTVDVAVLPIGRFVTELESRGVHLFIRWFDPSVIPNPFRMAYLDVVQEILMVGYPKGIWDRKNLLPIVRRGITASPPAIDFEGEPKFVIDAPVYPGSSGSPVVIHSEGAHAMKGGGLILGGRFHLLGILSQARYLDHAAYIETPDQDIPVRVPLSIGLGYVYKAHTVYEAARSYIAAHGADEAGT